MLADNRAFVSLADVVRAQPPAERTAAGTGGGSRAVRTGGDGTSAVPSVSALQSGSLPVRISDVPLALTPSGTTFDESADGIAAETGARSQAVLGGETGAAFDIAPRPPEACADAKPCGCAYAGALRDARLFRAALADAFELRIERLVEAFAAEVLGRELRLGRVDLAALAGRLLVERWVDEPLRLRVAPGEAPLTCDLPVVSDAALAPGDAILECRSGAIDARLAVRLTAVCDRSRT